MRCPRQGCQQTPARRRAWPWARGAPCAHMAPCARSHHPHGGGASRGLKSRKWVVSMYPKGWSKGFGQGRIRFDGSLMGTRRDSEGPFAMSERGEWTQGGVHAEVRAARQLVDHKTLCVPSYARAAKRALSSPGTVEMLTLICLPSSSEPSSISQALCAVSACSYSTKPKPRDLPSLETTLAKTTGPAVVKCA
jgi:hypothetical protein